MHRREIGQGFLSSLGDTALGLIYSLAAEGEAGILIAAKAPDSNQVCGFVCGTINTGAFYKAFLQRRFFQGLYYLGPKLLSPHKLFRALETLIYPTRKKVTDLPAAELLIIAVDRAYHGHGVAQGLFQALVQAFRQRGVAQFKVVAGEQLEQARRFYQKQGPGRVETIEVHRGQPSQVYIYDI